MIKAVIFDMDGLLIDSEPLWEQADKPLLKSLGIEYTTEERQALLGRGARRYIEHWYRVKPWKGASADEIADRLIDGFIDLFKKEGTIKPGARQTLDICKKASLLMALASSSPLKVINTAIDKLEIRHYFDEIYTGEHEPYGKPHPGVFITTANMLDVEPEDCLVFEDSSSGVLAAKAAKMKCIAVPEPEVRNDPFIRTADVILDSLEEFDESVLAELTK